MPAGGPHGAPRTDATPSRPPRPVRAHGADAEVDHHARAEQDGPGPDPDGDDAMTPPRDTRTLPFFRLGYWIGCGRLTDLPAIARIEAAVFIEPLDLRSLLRLACSGRARYLVARRGGTVCAYFGFQVLGPVAHVLANATHPHHRRHGLARTLLTAGEGVARRAGARWFLGEVRRSNRVQLDLLEGLGWRQVTACPRFFGNGEDAVLVVRVFGEPRDGAGRCGLGRP